MAGRSSRRWSRWWIATALLGGTVACSGIGGPAPAEHAAAENDTAPETLTEQPRLAALRESVPEDLGWEPGTTPWRALDVPSVSAATPAALLNKLSQELGLNDTLDDAAELTYRLERTDGDRAHGALLLWGLHDDALAGRDVRVTLRRADDGWIAERAEERWHCRRGLAEDRCL